MCFKIEWASLIVGRKFTVFVLFYFRFEGNFQVQASAGGGGGYIWRGDVTERFLRYEEVTRIITKMRLTTLFRKISLVVPLNVIAGNISHLF